MLQRIARVSLLLLIGASAAGPAFGQSGSITFVSGEVAVQRKAGTRAPATRGMAVNAGDVIVTGQQGMAQLVMVDQARISVRPNSQVEIEQYADRPDGETPAVLNVVRGTLRTFTGQLTAGNRDKYTMKTRIATVGIRGSGNVLFAGTAADCDPAKVGADGSACDITVNHTIEGSHAITFGDFSRPGLPAQQGGAAALITGPGQTVLVTARGDVRYIPTPQFIASAATNPTGAARSQAGTEGAGAETRDFAPSDSSGSSTQQGTQSTTPVGNNGLGFSFLDAAGNLPGSDREGLQDILMAGGYTYAGQAVSGDIRREGADLRSYRMYAGIPFSVEPAIDGGVARDSQSFASGGLNITAGRWENGVLAPYGGGTGSANPGSVHWIVANSSYPSYLPDVLTGTALYGAVVHTAPTNQLNTAGTLTGALLNVNFSNRSLSASIGVALPAAGGNAGGSWQLAASNVPIAGGSFYAATGNNLTITNGSGASSQGGSQLYGSLEGSFVGTGLQGAAVGYTFSDETASNPANFNSVNGVIGFQGPSQSLATPYRDGLVSDPMGVLGTALVRSFSTTNRPDEVTADAQGRATAFAAPYQLYGRHQSYTLGSASVAQSGLDPETGLVWGRWAGGVAVVTSGSAQQAVSLERSSLHYVFSGVGTGPVALPLTGSASYSLVGSTSPTDGLGNVGTLTNATLAADFGRRTVDLGVNVAIAGQSVAASAVGVPIYREQYFSAFRGNLPAGLPVPQLLNISCQPSCSNAVGSINGFFAGSTGQGAGMMYNLNGVSGAAAFRRPPGG